MVIYIYLMIPSSSPFSAGLNSESIISALGDCVRMAALYLEISGHERDPTTYYAKKVREVRK